MNSKPLQNWTPEAQSHGWRAIVLQIGAATLVSGAMAYVATNPQKVAHAVAVTAAQAAAPEAVAAPPLQTELVPVTFANPFDETEVFEFPSGTSETEARQSVAELLVQRARERKDAWIKARRSAHPPRRDTQGP